MDKTAFLHDTVQFNTIPIVKEFFLDTMTPIQLFQQLEEEAVFLLESRDEQSPWSRYSFIGLNPYGFLEEKEDEFIFKDAKDHTILKENDFKTAFQKVIAYLKVKSLDVSVPFYGGAVGYMCYDAISCLEKIKAHPINDLKLKRFSFLFCETILVLDHKNYELKLFHQIRLTGSETRKEKEFLYDQAMEKLQSIMEKINERRVSQNIPVISPEAPDDMGFERMTSNVSQAEYIRMVEKMKEYIRQGDIFQGVPSQRFEVDIHVSGLDIYRVLRVINPSPYLFYIKMDGIEIVGSSPERLIQVNNQKTEIHPIAGTRKRGDSPEEDKALAKNLLADEKELAEHFMLVDLARNDVGRVAKYGTVKTPVLTEVGLFSHVMHLISKVTGELKEDSTAIDALLAAFPAGTVSGAPKIRAMEIIRELEPTARNLYAGAVGYLGFDGNIDSCIAIRTMVIREGKAYIQAGAGIVADSEPEREWEESRNKAKALVKAIAVAEDIFKAKKGENMHV